MTTGQLWQQVDSEFEALRAVVAEIDALLAENAEGDPGVRVSTLVGAFMQQFYNGVESVLKRLCQYHGIPLPEGHRFHADLLGLFGPDHPDELPEVLDETLFADLDRFRQFRHVFRTSYGFPTRLDAVRTRRGHGWDSARTV